MENHILKKYQKPKPKMETLREIFKKVSKYIPPRRLGGQNTHPVSDFGIKFSKIYTHSEICRSKDTPSRAAHAVNQYMGVPGREEL